MQLSNRAEQKCMVALLNDASVQAIYGKKKIFMGYAAPGTATTFNEYILIRRISGNSLDGPCTSDTPTDNLRRVRIQIDISDVSYTNMISRSELVRDVISRECDQSSVDGDTYGTITNGNTVWNVTSVDIFLTESEV